MFDHGLRPQYHAHYYAAFVIGPDGQNIEAVCHQPTDWAGHRAAACAPWPRRRATSTPGWGTLNNLSTARRE